jgi:hypothetical protein
MKQPDDQLYLRHRLLRAKITDIEEAEQELREKKKQARMKLDEFEKKHGNLDAQMIRWLEIQQEQAKAKEPVDQVWLAQLRARNASDMEAMNGIWWDTVENGVPIPFAETIKKDSFPPEATMAHILVHLGIFPSVNQAKKAGKATPITLGEHRFKLAGGGMKRIILE